MNYSPNPRIAKLQKYTNFFNEQAKENEGLEELHIKKACAVNPGDNEEDDATTLLGIKEIDASDIGSPQNARNTISLSNMRVRFFGLKENAVKKLTGRLLKEEMYSTFIRSLPLNYTFINPNKKKFIKIFNRLLEDTLYEIDKGSHDLTSPEVVSRLMTRKNSAEIYDNCKDCALDQIDSDIYHKTGIDSTDIINNPKGMGFLLNELPAELNNSEATKKLFAESGKDLDDDIKDDFEALNKEPKDALAKTITDKVVDAVAKEKKEAEDRNEENDKVTSELKAADETDAESTLTDREDLDPNQKSDGEMDVDMSPEQEDASKANDGGATEPKLAKPEKEAKDATENVSEGYDIANFNPVKMSRMLYQNKRSKYSLFKTIHIATTKKYLEENMNLNEGASTISIDSDLVLAESITYYTLLETFNAFGLFKDTNNDKIKSHIEYVISKI